MARLWPGSTLVWFRLNHFTNKSVSMPLSVCASLRSGFLFCKTRDECAHRWLSLSTGCAGEKVPSIVVLWAIMLCAQCELIQSQSVKQIWTHLHFNDVKCGEMMYIHQPGGFERHCEQQLNYTVQTVSIHMFHCWHEGKCFSFVNDTRPATWCTSAFILTLG